jgi:hypothetical protein
MSSAGKRNFIETAPVGKRRPREKAGNARQINEKKQSVEAARITAASAPAGKAAPADGGRGDMAGTADREGSEDAVGTTDRAARPGPSLHPGRSGIQACFDLLFESTAFYSKRTGLLPRLQARPVNSARAKGAPAPPVRLTIADEAPGRKTTGRMRSLYFAGVLYSTRTRASGKPSGRRFDRPLLSPFAFSLARNLPDGKLRRFCDKTRPRKAKIWYNAEEVPACPRMRRTAGRSGRTIFRIGLSKWASGLSRHIRPEVPELKGGLSI